jgi:transglutaminase-like putative cysteine protease
MALPVFDKLAPLGIGGISPAGPSSTARDENAPTKLADWRPERCRDVPRSIVFQLNNGSPDAEQIIEHLAYFAIQYGKNPCVMAFARRLTQGITESNAVEEQFSAVASFILDSFTYQADPRGAEYVRSPIRMISEFCKNGYSRGDCDDITLLGASLFNALGIPVRILAVKLTGSDVYNHVLLQVNIRGVWRWFDGCNKEDPKKVWDNPIYRQI